MNRQASILFNFIDSSFSGNSLALQEPYAQHSYYQELICAALSRSICTTEGFQSLGRQLADIARHAYFAKQIQTVDRASQMMLALPISGHLRSVARHYQALCAKQRGDFDNARRLFERVLEEATPQYTARTLQAIGLTCHARGKIVEALPFYVAAGKAAIDCDPLTLAGSQAMIAIVRSTYGDHKQALDDLERLFPLVRSIGKHYPAFYYDYINSLAVELGEVGRIHEAEAACAIALASPFAAVHPNWSETRDEIAAKRTSATPSVIAVSAAPELAPSPQPAREAKPARALVLIQPAREIVFFQTSIAIAFSAVAGIEISSSILDQVRRCIYPRGPPSRFRS